MPDEQRERDVASPRSAAEDAFSEGERLLHAGDYEAAINAFDRALRLDPDYAPAYWLRRRAYDSLGRSGEGTGEPQRREPQSQHLAPSATAASWRATYLFSSTWSSGKVGSGLVPAILGIPGGLVGIVLATVEVGSIGLDTEFLPAAELDIAQRAEPYFWGVLVVSAIGLALSAWVLFSAERWVRQSQAIGLLLAAVAMLGLTIATGIVRDQPTLFPIIPLAAFLVGGVFGWPESHQESGLP